ncbi:Coiled-coil domain-containing protein 63, partial [Blyttiomyces sp. JEL0837]
MQNDEALMKQIRVLKNRLDKASIIKVYTEKSLLLRNTIKAVEKANSASTMNKRLRGIIDHLRRERFVFENLHTKLERELLEQKKYIAELVGQSNAAYEY